MQRQRSPAFRSMVRGATGGGEVWSHTNEDVKMSQYGWRCKNSEDLYSTDVLIGNWNEERWDLKEIKRNHPLPSQFDHYYTPTAAESYNKDPVHMYPKDLKMLKERLPHAFSAHQPELDPPMHQAYCNSWQTTQRASYLDPKLRLEPMACPHAEETPNPCQ
ncbi:upf0686 protein c11orf1-like protein [Plakobranchus ocellatus]|uniref:Upf0686 protein c11orf1-like protein n=1 Tax=Plakobranchus ocellatus TaxID=259542 RepID=A0AAV4DRP2_9GAST|nr:upf0686 protein c11orf1-like protein [Plakobranchus ocellatus]